MLSLRDLLLKDFKVDLPISGGTGNSLGNAIIIHRREPNDYVGVEYAILKFLGIGRGISWKLVEQRLMYDGPKRIDVLKIEAIKTTTDEIITTIENYYFDVTECYGLGRRAAE